MKNVETCHAHNNAIYITDEGKKQYPSSRIFFSSNHVSLSLPLPFKDVRKKDSISSVYAFVFDKQCQLSILKDSLTF